MTSALTLIYKLHSQLCRRCGRMKLLGMKHFASWLVLPPTICYMSIIMAQPHCLQRFLCPGHHCTWTPRFDQRWWLPYSFLSSNNKCQVQIPQPSGQRYKRCSQVTISQGFLFLLKRYIQTSEKDAKITLLWILLESKRAWWIDVVWRLQIIRILFDWMPSSWLDWKRGHANDCTHFVDYQHAHQIRWLRIMWYVD